MTKKSKDHINVGPPTGTVIFKIQEDNLNSFYDDAGQLDVDGYGENIHRFGQLEWIMPEIMRQEEFDPFYISMDNHDRHRLREDLALCCDLYHKLKNSIDQRPPIKSYLDFIAQLSNRYEKKFTDLSKARKHSLDETAYSKVSKLEELSLQKRGAINANLRDAHRQLAEAKELIAKASQIISSIDYSPKPGPVKSYASKISLYILAYLYEQFAVPGNHPYVTNIPSPEEKGANWLYQGPFFKFATEFFEITDPNFMQYQTNNGFGQQAMEMSALYRNKPDLASRWNEIVEHDVLIEFMEMVGGEIE